MKMNSIMELQNPKGSNVYSIANAKAHSTPMGSNIIHDLFSTNITILRIEKNQLKEAVK